MDSLKSANILFQKCQNILVDRHKEYGDSKKALLHICELWDFILMDDDSKCNKCVSPAKVCMMMVMMKLVREKNKHKLDNIVDIINYLALYEQFFADEDFMEENSGYNMRIHDSYNVDALLRGLNGRKESSDN